MPRNDIAPSRTTAHNHGLRLALAVASFAALAGGPTAEAQHRLCFYVKKGIPGHAFVQFLPVNGPQANRRDLVYGKYPKGWNKFGGAGIVKDDSKHAWDQRICFNVTWLQYNAAAAKVRGKIAAPPNYHLTRDPPGNCVDWMTDTATAATLALPNKRWRGIGTPASFGAALKALGNGGGFGGGTVEINDDGAIGPDGETISVTTAEDLDAEVAAASIHSDALGLANYLHLPLSNNVLGTFETNQATPFSFEVFNTSPDDALISVQWGDLTEVDAQQLNFSHLYAAAGLYDVSVGIINEGDVHVFEMQVNVVSGGQDDPVPTIVVPTSTPAAGDNLGFDVDEFPEFVVEDTIPTLNQWGLILMTLALLAAAAKILTRRKAFLGIKNP